MGIWYKDGDEVCPGWSLYNIYDFISVQQYCQIRIGDYHLFMHVRASDETLYILRYSNICFFQIKSSEGITISKEGSFHKLKIHKVTEEFAGKYKFEADGRKTEALILVEGKNILLPETIRFIKGLHH